MQLSCTSIVVLACHQIHVMSFVYFMQPVSSSVSTFLCRDCTITGNNEKRATNEKYSEHSLKSSTNQLTGSNCVLKLSLVEIRHESFLL